jgi:predicted 3-demethylubiquinone-9 3-methyltransferase (glyoxalase superfamily)
VRVDKQKITPHLWYDTQAREAAELYAAALGGADSKVLGARKIHDTPSGTAEIVSARLLGQDFQLISAGPFFTFTPAISFLVACGTRAEVQARWDRLSEGGSVLMGLGSYPFSPFYGWVQDRWGLSWQIMLMPKAVPTQRITPTLMFVGKQCGKAEEAIGLYTSVFAGSSVGGTLRYAAGEQPDRQGTIKHAEFDLAGQRFAAMDSAHGHEFGFTEAISFIVHCDTQEEIDHYWGGLSAVPEAEQCGWLKDRYGVSWQIVPRALNGMMSGDAAAAARVTRAFLAMKKFDLAALQRAFEGN